MMIMVMNLNPVKDSSGCEEKKRDEEILVDADSRHLKAPDGDDQSINMYFEKVLIEIEIIVLMSLLSHSQDNHRQAMMVMVMVMMLVMMTILMTRFLRILNSIT